MSTKIPITAFGKCVKIAIVEQDLSQKELAERIGITAPTLNDVLFGRNSSIKTMERIAKELKLEQKWEESF